jgi:hypothetical protein
MKPWSKREIKAMTDALTSFMVHHRPVSAGFGDTRGAQFEEALRRTLNEKRTEMIVAILNCDIARRNEYITKAHEYLAHAEAHPEACGEYSVNVTRRALSMDEKFVSWTNRLLARIDSEPLPDEVVNFDPLRA